MPTKRARITFLTTVNSFDLNAAASCLLLLLVPTLCSCHHNDDSTRHNSSSDRVPSSHREMVVLAAASLQDTLNQVVDIFTLNQPEVSIKIGTGPSNVLAQQIISGAPADIYISANPQWVEALEKEGLTQNRIHLLTNTLVLIVPTFNRLQVQSLADLQRTEVHPIAVAHPRVPVGMYAQQALNNSGILDFLRKERKLVFGSDARHTLALVERGEVAAGLVYATDAACSSMVKIATTIDRDLHEPIIYSAVQLKRAEREQSSDDFFRFLQSSQAKKIFVRNGFSPFTTP